jgi:AhpD family alkylhydroperoxidase
LYVSTFSAPVKANKFSNRNNIRICSVYHNIPIEYERKETPKDILPQMWPLFKKYQIGESVIPQTYKEMMMLAAAAAVKCSYCQTYHKEVPRMWDASEEKARNCPECFFNILDCFLVTHTKVIG